MPARSALRIGVEAAEALETMGREHLNQLPVFEREHLEGVVSRGQTLRLLQSRMERKA